MWRGQEATEKLQNCRNQNYRIKFFVEYQTYFTYCSFIFIYLPFLPEKSQKAKYGMLGALFSCSFSTISVAALCQDVLCVCIILAGWNEINMKLSPQLAMQPTFELCYFQLRI